MCNNCFHHPWINSGSCLTFRTSTVMMWQTMWTMVANMRWRNHVVLPVQEWRNWRETINIYRYCWRRYRSLEVIQLASVNHLRFTRFITVQKLNVITFGSSWWWLTTTYTSVLYLSWILFRPSGWSRNTRDSRQELSDPFRNSGPDCVEWIYEFLKGLLVRM